MWSETSDIPAVRVGLSGLEAAVYLDKRRGAVMPHREERQRLRHSRRRMSLRMCTRPCVKNIPLQASPVSLAPPACLNSLMIDKPESLLVCLVLHRLIL